MKTKKFKTSKPDPQAIEILHEFWRLFINSRSLSVYLPDNINGSSTLIPGEFYQAITPYSCVILKVPLSEEIRQEHNRIGAWTNENFIIRLWAILESRGFTKPIRNGLRGSKVVRFLKQLRQFFAHGTGLFDDNKAKHRKLRRDLLNLFPMQGNYTGLPLNIDYVMFPMFKQCLDYVHDVLNSEADNINESKNKTKDA